MSYLKFEWTKNLWILQFTKPSNIVRTISFSASHQGFQNVLNKLLIAYKILLAASQLIALFLFWLTRLTLDWSPWLVPCPCFQVPSSGPPPLPVAWSGPRWLPVPFCAPPLSGPQAKKISFFYMSNKIKNKQRFFSHPSLHCVINIRSVK